MNEMFRNVMITGRGMQILMIAYIITAIMVGVIVIIYFTLQAMKVNAERNFLEEKTERYRKVIEDNEESRHNNK